MKKFSDYLEAARSNKEYQLVTWDSSESTKKPLQLINKKEIASAEEVEDYLEKLKAPFIVSSPQGNRIFNPRSGSLSDPNDGNIEDPSFQQLNILIKK